MLIREETARKRRNTVGRYWLFPLERNQGASSGARTTRRQHKREGHNGKSMLVHGTWNRPGPVSGSRPRVDIGFQWNGNSKHVAEFRPLNAMTNMGNRIYRVPPFPFRAFFFSPFCVSSRLSSRVSRHRAVSRAVSLPLENRNIRSINYRYLTRRYLSFALGFRSRNFHASSTNIIPRKKKNRKRKKEKEKAGLPILFCDLGKKQTRN